LKSRNRLNENTARGGVARLSKLSNSQSIHQL